MVCWCCLGEDDVISVVVSGDGVAVVLGCGVWRAVASVFIVVVAVEGSGWS